MIRSAALAILFATCLTAHASEEPKGKADPAKGKAIAETICVACHGADGNSVISMNPILASQVEEYLLKQLRNFKGGEKPAARNSPIMGGMVAALSDEDMKNVASWFASQKQNPAPAPANDEAKTALGQKIWRQGDFKKGVPACAGCHGPAGAGLPAQFPRLAGQFPEYTEAQLKAFRSSDRANDAEAVMRTIAAKLSDVEINAVAGYAATLR
jgi:cytochrome c553